MATGALPLLAFLDPATGQIASTQSAPPGLTDESFFIDGDFWQLGLTPPAFYRIDPDTHAVTATVAVPANNTGNWTVDSGTIWVTDGSHLRLYALDTNTGAQIHDYTLWDTPDHDTTTGGVAVGAGSVWVVANNFGKVLRVDPATGTVQKVIDVPNANNVSFGNGAAWTTGAGSMSRIDPQTNEVTFSSQLREFHAMPWMTFSADAAWTADETDGTVFEVDRGGNVVGTFETGAGARPLQYMAGRVWVANQDAGTVSAIDASTGSVQTYTFGHQVTNLAAGNGQVLIAVDKSSEDVIAELPGHVLTVAMTSDALQSPSPDPATDPYIYNRMILYATCSRLLDYGDAGGADGYQLRPEVAGNMPEISADGLTYTFTVKPGFKFSPPSNEEITAETYRYSMERALSGQLTDNGKRAIQSWSDIVGATAFHDGKADHVSGLQASGDKLTITLTAPSNDFLERLMLPYSCPVPLGTPAVPTLDPITPVPSSGPYYLAAHYGGELAILKPNPNYGGTRQPGYDAIALRFGLSDGEAVQWVDDGRAGMAIGSTAIQAGTDVAQEWGPESANGSSGDQRWYPIPYPGVDYLLVNPNGKLTSDPVVRRAIALALDRAGAAQSYFEPGTTTILNESVPIQDPEVTELVGPDPTTAKANLAGRTGTIRFAIQKNCDQCLDSANSIKSSLAAIGITVELVADDDPIGLASDSKSRIDIVDAYTQPFYPNSGTLMDGIVTNAPTGWFSDAESAQAAALLTESGSTRDQAAADLAHQLVEEATIIPFGGSIDGVYFNSSVGCRTIVAGIMNVDLTALCPASP